MLQGRSFRVNPTLIPRYLWRVVIAFIIVAVSFGGRSATVVVARPLFAGTPVIILDVPDEGLLGADVDFSVTFNNNGPDIGYGPFIDLILDTTGADADSDGGPYDGLGTTKVEAEYLEVPFVTTGPSRNMWVLTFNSSGNATHPLARNASGNYITVTGTPGDKLVVLKLPFGSFTLDQPPATMDLTVNMSNFADVGTPLAIQARGGYQFGYTPEDDWCCGSPPDSADQTLSLFINDAVTPILWTLSKDYSGPEDEAASGPNFRDPYPIRYTVTATVAPGQSVTSLVLRDVLPDNLQFFNLISTNPAAACTDPGTSTPGGQIECSYPNPVSGSASFTFDYYIPLNDADGDRVIDPLTGLDPLLPGFATSCNNALASASWEPLDPRDIGTPLPPLDLSGCEHTLTDKSIAIQKGYTIEGGGGPRPGAVVIYTLTFQVSDFFAFNDLVVTDIVSDGQHVVDPADFIPTLRVDGNPNNLSTLPMVPGVTYDVDCNYTSLLGPGPECTIDSTGGPNDGKTTLTFRVSDEIFRRGADASGRMIGGCVNPGGGSTDPDCDLAHPGGYNAGPTTATITFRTIIQDNFTDDHLLPGHSGDPSVDQGDVFDDDVSVRGAILDNTDVITPTTFEVEDGSHAGLEINTGELNKTVYAINGDADPDNWEKDSLGKVRIKPGDTVTYRITYDMPISDEENLKFTDYLPLPVFHVLDPDEDGAPGPDWTFDATVSAAAPLAGVAKFGPNDTFYNYSGNPGTSDPPGKMIPTVDWDDPSNNNNLIFDYGDFNDSRHLPTTVDLLFTLTVSINPFADGLYLTNEAHAFEGSTNADSVAADAIIQVVLGEPVLVSKKSVIWTDNPGAVFNPAVGGGGVAFLDPTNFPRWSGTISSNYLRNHPINSDVSRVDAADIVSFAIVIENTGSSLKGAFDITITDNMPAQFQIPGGGLNLQVYYGNGTGPIEYTRPDDTNAVDTDLFGVGIKLKDPVGEGVCQAHNPNSGNNIILITYDLQLLDDVNPGRVENTSIITNYAGEEGGPNHVPTPGPGQNYPASVRDSAAATINASPTKYLISTTAPHTDDPDVAIGEVIHYRLVMQIPEATSPNFQVRDRLPADLPPTGLTYIDDGTATIAFVSNSGITSTGLGIIPSIPWGCNISGGSADATSPASPLPCTLADENVGRTSSTTTDDDNYISGTDPYFKLGALRNDDRDPNGEYVVIEFSALVENSIDASNDNGDTLDNRARVIIDGAQSGSDSAAVRVQIVEPVLNIAKTVSDTQPAPGQVVTFRLTITHEGTSTADAFDVVVTDVLPADLELDLSSVDVDLNDGATGMTNNSHDNTVNVSIASIPWNPPPGTSGSVTIEFQATVSDTVSQGQVLDNLAEMTWTSLRSPDDNGERTGEDGVGGVLNDYADNSAISLTANKDLTKDLVDDTPQANTTSPDVTIGEVLTYEIVMMVPPGDTPNAFLTDTLHSGLAFVDCSDITAGATVTSTTIDLHGAGNCNHGAAPGSNPLIENSGGKVKFNFGTISNSDANPQPITVRYRVVVLDTLPNQDGGSLTNSVKWEWSGGSLEKSALPLRIVEPDLALVKEVDRARVWPGQEVTFTLSVSHTSDSDTDAFDVVMTDVVPDDLEYVPGSLVWVSGLLPDDLDDTNAPSLRVVWNTFPWLAVAEIEFRAIVGDLYHGQSVTNTAALEWSSIPGDWVITPDYNSASRERGYNPASPPDTYVVSASAAIQYLALPGTGFAPGRVTFLPVQPENAYQSLGGFWLEISQLGVQLPIVGVPLREDGWDLTWLGAQAGWLEGTAYPTWAGNSAITAHIYMPDGSPGPFVKLNQMRWGQQIIVHASEQRYIYQVREIRRVRPDDLSVLKHEKYPWLTLITCQGFNEARDIYNYRVVVRAVLVKVEAEPVSAPSDSGK